MNSFIEHQDEYLDLFRRFIAGDVDGVTFCNQHMFWWRRDSHKDNARMLSWPERYDLEMLFQFERGEISADEFRRRRAYLGGYKGFEHFLTLADKLFSACDMFEASPKATDNPDDYYTESQLRDYVVAVLDEYERAQVASSL